MIIKLRDGRLVNVGKVESEGMIFKVEIRGKKATKYRMNNYILTARYKSKEAGSFNVNRPTTVYDYHYGKHVGEVGYYIAKEFRGSGLSYFLMYHAARFVLNRGITIVLAATTLDNKASIKLFENCGGVRVGHFNKPMKIKGKFKDVIWMETPTKNLIRQSRKKWVERGIKIVKIGEAKA